MGKLSARGQAISAERIAIRGNEDHPMNNSPCQRLQRFADEHRLKARIDEDGTKIIPGKLGHIFRVRRGILRCDDYAKSSTSAILGLRKGQAHRWRLQGRAGW